MAQGNNTKRAIKFAAVILGCIIIPLMYSFFYLNAFWDPYSRLEKVPVAIVNNDTGANISGENRNVGKEICDELKDEKALKFVFTDEKTAVDGTKGSKYYAMLTIPEDFSMNISTIDKTHKKVPAINYMVNDKRNYLASQILNNAVRKIEKKVTSNLDKEITGTLVGNLQDVPGQLEVLGDGMNKMYDGAIKLDDGGDTLVKGVSTLSAGANKLDVGVAKLAMGAEKLNSGAKELTGGSKKIDSGAKSLSKGIKDADNGAKKLKDGSGKLSSGLGELQNGFGKLGKNVPSLTSGISKLDKGMNGDSGLKAEIGNYTAGVRKLYGGAEELAKGTSQLKTSVESLSNALGGVLGNYKADLPDAEKAKMLDALVGGMQKSGGIQALATGVSKVNQGAQTLNTGLSKLNGSSKSLNDGAKNIGDGVSELNKKVPVLTTGISQLSDGVNSAKTGSDKLDGGITDLGKGTGQLNAGALKLSSATSSLVAGAGTLSRGTAILDSGAKELKNGSGNLNTGADKLLRGSKTLSNGIKTLTVGIAEGADKVNSKVDSSKKEVKKLDGVDKYASEPLKVDETEYQYVKNYGTAFAPYFMSLSLWVGGLIIFFGIYYDLDRRFKWLCRDSDKPLLRSFVYLLLGLAQAVLLAVIVKYALGLQVNHMGAYFASCLLVSVVFISIIQFCIVHLGDIGKFIAMLLLILQLTSCGGTFPMETVPKMFNVLYPFMPMTYSVGLFKETISGNLGGNMSHNVAILVMMLVVFMVFTIVFSVVKRGKKMLQDKHNADIENPVNV